MFTLFFTFKEGGSNGLFLFFLTVHFSLIIFYSKIYPGQLHDYAACASYPVDTVQR